MSSPQLYLTFLYWERKGGRQRDLKRKSKRKCEYIEKVGNIENIEKRVRERERERE